MDSFKDYLQKYKNKLTVPIGLNMLVYNQIVSVKVKNRDILSQCDYILANFAA